MMFAASQAILIGLPERYEEIMDPKTLSFLKNDRAFMKGVDLCQRYYAAAAGGGKSFLARTARYVKTNYLVYYYINLIGDIGVH